MKLFKSRSERAIDDGVDTARDIADKAGDKADGLLSSGRDQLHQVIDQIESVLNTAKGTSVDDLKSSVFGALSTARSAVNERSSNLRGNLNDALEQADQVARKKPWHVVGAVAGVALLVGFLAGR